MFFDGWQGLIRVLVVGLCAYAGLIVLLRASGKRTLSKMNAFDFVVTVALGSTLASILTSKDVALVEGLLALALLIGLQYGITWLSVRSNLVKRALKSDPALLYYEGSYVASALKRERVDPEEIIQSMRSANVDSLDTVQAIVLETDGTLSFVPYSDAGPDTMLSNVRRPTPGAV